ncbi:MAG: hypothetical protein ABSG76_15365 [Xanthobacteraceae bacterium]
MKMSTVAAILTLSVMPASAAGLTDADYEFLGTLHVGRTDAVLRGLGPREQAHLHALINDRTTADDAPARVRNVSQAMQESGEHQAWEVANPGQLWNARRTELPRLR